MAQQSRLAGDGQASADSETTDERARQNGLEPFSLSYELDSYDVDSEAIDRGLSLLIALTNLL